MMRAYTADVTADGLVELPEDVKKVLDLRGSGRIQFIVENHEVKIVGGIASIRELAGSFPAYPGHSPDYDQEIEAALDEETRRFERTTRGS